jgi:uncharacterized protein YkwD
LIAGCAAPTTQRSDTSIAAAAEATTALAGPQVFAGPAPLQVQDELLWAYRAAAASITTLTPDRRLAIAATELLEGYDRTGVSPNRFQRNAAARRAGVAEPVPLLLVITGSRRNDVERSLMEQLATRCRQISCNRIGLASLTNDGEHVLVALAMANRLRLDPIQTTARSGDAIQLRGGALQHDGPVEVLVATPSGTVETLTQSDDGSFDTSFNLEESGLYRFEILAEINRSPTVLALFPVTVGGGQPPPLVPPGQTTSPSDARVVLKRLVNETRRGVGVNELAYDERLEAAAQSHADSMVRSTFFSHRDPSGRGPAERVVAQGMESPLVLENLAMATTAEQTFATLLESPAHLRAMLHANTTHVGIGIATQGEESLNVVILMAQLHQRLSAEEATERVFDDVNAARRAANLTNLAREQRLDDAALNTVALLARLAEGGVDDNAARRSAQDALMEQSLPPLRAVLVTTRHLDDLASIEVTLDAHMSRVGMAVQPSTDAELGYHVVMLLAADSSQ